MGMTFEEYEKFDRAADESQSMLAVLSLALSNGHSAIDYEELHRVVGMIHERTSVMTRLVNNDRKQSVNQERKS